MDFLNQLKHVLNKKNDVDKENFKIKLEQAKFSELNQLIRGFYEEMNKMEENEFKIVKDWLDFAKELLPNLSIYSPSWQNTWEELQFIYDKKVELYNRVPKDERKGEWQVLFDNPYSNEAIVCHTSIPFARATFIMAKYQFDLKRAEYVQLQKVVTAFTKKGV